MSPSLRRSLLLVPADTFVWTTPSGPGRPDGLVLDPSGLVHPDARPAARGRLQDLVSAASRDTAVYVRVSPEDLQAELEASVWPGLAGIVLPGPETPEGVTRVEETLADLESRRALPPGGVKIVLLLDSVQALWNQVNLASASPRVDGLIFGVGDQLYELTEKEETLPLLTGPVPRFPTPEYAWGRFAYLAAMSGVQRFCLLGTSVAPGHINLQELIQAARRARALGFQGAVTPHTDGVDTCNQGFSLSQEAAAWARRTLERERPSQEAPSDAGPLWEGPGASVSARKRAKALLERGDAAGR